MKRRLSTWFPTALAAVVSTGSWAVCEDSRPAQTAAARPINKGLRVFTCGSSFHA